MKKKLSSLFFLFLMTSLCFDLSGVESLQKFRSLPDNRVAVRTSLGVRHVEAIDSTHIQLVIGHSCCPDVAGEAAAYRLVSFTDSNYAYTRFVSPVAADVNKIKEVSSASEASLPVFYCTVVNLTCPHVLKEGHEYHVIAQGVGSAMVTGAHTAGSFHFPSEGKPKPVSSDVDLAVIGLRNIEPVGNGIVMLELGPGFSTGNATSLESYHVSRNGKPEPVLRMGRISRVDAYLPVGWPFKAIPMHEVFLQLKSELKDGDTLRVEVDPKLTAGLREAELQFNKKSVLSNSIKVNQIGYIAESPVKGAYLGRWMGSFPEKTGSDSKMGTAGGNSFWQALGDTAAGSDNKTVSSSALLFEEPPHFFVCEANSGRKVFEGTSELVHRSGTFNEGVYSMDYSGENVYALNFGSVCDPGLYYICMEGVGRSLSFEIGSNVYNKAFKLQAYGVFAQRCGIELKPPYSNWRRIACHLGGIIPTTLSRWSGESRAHKEFPNHVDYSLSHNFSLPNEVEALNRDASLLAYWPLDGNLKDISGRNNHLSSNAAQLHYMEVKELMPGANKALGPSEAESARVVVNQLHLNTTNGLTICGWVKLGGGIKFEGTLWGNDPGDWNDPRIRIAAGWGVLRGEFGKQTTDFTIGRLSDGKWHHIAQVAEVCGSDSVRASIYVDGELRCTGNVPCAATREKFCLGYLTGDECSGKAFDDVRVYERALTPADIRNLATRYGEKALALQAFGGHHDAGDYNPRSHIDVAKKLMNAYEIAPGKFLDKQLNIPEAGNGIPDILDEAQWALRLWIDLQDKDGGVWGGTESNGDPNFIQTVELDTLGDYAFAKDVASSYVFAGAMAQAARIWSRLGLLKEGNDFLMKAQRAYDWAEAHKPENVADPRHYSESYLSPKAYAAAQLLHTTGQEKFNKDFLAVCVWSRKGDAELDVHGLYDQSEAAWAYITCNKKWVDEDILKAVEGAVCRRADMFIEHCSSMAYRFIKHPWAPITWGSGSYQNSLEPLIWAYKLTDDEKYKAWIIRTCDNTLGANPLNRSYITGLGQRTVRAPLHNSRYSHFGEVVQGMHVQGPNQRGEGYQVAETAYPALNEKFAPLYTFVDCHFAISMDEGTISSQAMSMAVFGLLQQDTTTR